MQPKSPIQFLDILDWVQSTHFNPRVQHCALEQQCGHFMGGKLTSQVRISSFQVQSLVQKRASLWHDSINATNSFSYQVLRLANSQLPI